jgi:peptidyl-prolyl cis-trans isomerase SurA
MRACLKTKATFLACLLLAGAALRTTAEPVAVNGIVAIVNDSIITWQAVEELAAPAIDVALRMYARQPQVLQQKINEARGEALNQLVERKLILHDFTVSGYNLPESVIEDTIQDRIRERFRDRLGLTRTLQAQGMTYESYRQQIREQIIVDALRSRHISAPVIISPAKIEAYYRENPEKFKQEEQVRLRMIVLNQPAGAPPDTAQKLAREILLKLEEGVPFAEMASVYSEGSQRGEGGDWGWVERSVLRQELADAAFALQPGQRSGVIVTPEACYLMLVEERKPAGPRTLSDVRDEIEQTLLAEERARLQQKYVDRLKAKSFILYMRTY